ncbi:hypothetical protein EV177_007334 [Coemansia sp. RSA 1804]|nr:hypothetical protein EV177_007334 [Coemansia sp. RSA 1804]
MRFPGFLASAIALFAALGHSLPVANTNEESSAVYSAEEILKLDTDSGCLPSAVKGISAQDREVIYSVARELKNSLFRDFHQFGPVALALSKPDIQEKITGSDYLATIEGLRELQKHIDSNVPSIAKAASSNKSECDAPTVDNLQVVYTNLVTLLQQFS